MSRPSSAAPAGYSGTPLIQKLGIKASHRVAIRQEPPTFAASLGPLPPGVRLVRGSAGVLDVIVVFFKTERELQRRFAVLAERLAPAGMLWIAWPKKSSGVPSDLSENRVREIGLAEGLVDVKVCAIDETWSGLKFVRRLKDR
ncbi:MAG TPA: DUF3052 domain-containing protein [Gemmatimonadaceae bacterium]|nr:DUF3052 domain-containing protein [Gemmatimonadaceae bacterium]